MNSEISGIDQSHQMMGMGVVELALLAGLANGTVKIEEDVSPYLSQIYDGPVAQIHADLAVRRLRHLGWIDEIATPDLSMSANGSTALNTMYKFVVRLIDNGANLLDYAMLTKMLKTNGDRP